MRPYYNAAAVSIVPLRVGGGTRLKIAESLAMGVPVVSTRIGAEGLDAQAGRDLLVADDPAAFANAVVRVLSDARLRTDLAANGRRLVEVKYVWTDLAEELAANLLDIVREGVLDSGRGSR
jgi:glycosyltransferase involved in cell wall biosynthesis